MNYQEFLEQKTQAGGYHGFSAIDIPDYLFPFQKDLVSWAVHKGRSAIFASCGLGKTPMQLVWADNVARYTNKPVLILAPLAVSYQTQREAEKFSIDCGVSRRGKIHKHITVTNYEKAHLFNPYDFSGIVCDESSCIKDQNSKRRDLILDYMKKVKYRLLCSATPSPNSYTELGNSSEALGELGFVEMLTRYFTKNTDKNKRASHKDTNYQKGMIGMWEGKDWRFRGHSEMPFWQWVSIWAKAVRKPSDLGYSDDGFLLPNINETRHIVRSDTIEQGMLFALPAIGLNAQRRESRRTIKERAEFTASIVNESTEQFTIWCHLNDEGDALEDIIPDAIQISGKDSDESKESKLIDFINGGSRVLVTKPKIGAWGLNMQNCHNTVYFPDHSFEYFHQAMHRHQRYGQKHRVNLHLVMSESHQEVVDNLSRKAIAAERMFDRLCLAINGVDLNTYGDKEMELPSWL